jgi:hypothetical protein
LKRLAGGDPPGRNFSRIEHLDVGALIAARVFADQPF